MAANYSFRIGAEGIDAFVNDMQRAAAGNDQLAQAWQRFVAASPGLANAMDRAQAATQQAAERVNTFRSANDNATRSTGNLSQVVGQAGFQVQDFAVQVQSGTSALTALSQQGSQFLGVFGQGGAVAGAVLTVTLLVAQLIAGKKSTDEWADAIKGQADAYRTATEAADRWREGMQNEAQQVLNLRAYYASLGEERRAYELRQVERQRADLEEQQKGLRLDVTRTLGGRISPAQLEQADAAASRLPADQRAIFLDNPELDRLRQGVRVLDEFRSASVITEDTLAQFSARLREIAGDARDRFSQGLRSAADELEKSGPKARELSAAIGQLDERFRALNGQLSTTQSRLAALREAQVDNPLAGLAAEASNIQSRLAALGSGGLAGLERVTQQQTQQAEITRRATAAQSDFVKALIATGVSAEEAARRGEEAAPGFVALSTRVVTETARLEALRKQAEENRRNAERAGRREEAEAEAEAKRKQREAERAFLRDADSNLRELKASDEVQRRAEEERRKEEERQRQSIDRTVERYSQQLSTGVTDALFDGFENGASAVQTFSRALSRALRTAVASAFDTELIRPFLSSIIGGLRGAGSEAGGASAASGGLGEMFGLSGLGGQLRSSLGLDSAGGWFSGLGGRLNDWGASSGIFGNGISPAMQGPTITGAPLGSLSQSGLLGSASLTQFVGGVGLGFGAGSLAGSVVQGARGTQGPGGMIGAGIGSIAGFLVGGPVGALIGGVLGGAGGGLIGPTKKGMESRAGGDVSYAVDSSGRLVITGARGKRWDQAGATAQVQGQLDELNTGAASRGLTFAGISGAVGFGQASGSPRELSQSALLSALRSSNANDRTAFATLAGQGKGISEAFSAVDFIRQTYEPLAKLAGPVDAFGEALQKIRDDFAQATAKAAELGLATDRLNQARDREIAKATLQREASALNTIAGQQNTLLGFLNGLAGESLSPQNALTLAQQNFGKAVDAARSAGLGRADLSGVVTAGRSLVEAGRAFYATGPGSAELQDFVERSVTSLGAQLNLPAFGGSLDLAVESITGLTDEVQLLRDEVGRLREELRSARILRAA